MCDQDLNDHYDICHKQLFKEASESKVEDRLQAWQTVVDKAM